MADNNSNGMQRKMARLVEASVDVATCVVEGEEYKGRKVKALQASIATQIIKAMAPKFNGEQSGGLHLHLNVPRPGETRTLAESAPKVLEAKPIEPIEFTNESEYSATNKVNKH